MTEKGILFTCDICNKKGSFVHFDDETLFPDGWVHVNGKDICPKCFAEAVKKEEQHNFEERIKEDTGQMKPGIPW